MCYFIQTLPHCSNIDFYFEIVYAGSTWIAYMNFLRNKYFLLGVLLLLAIAIPVTIYVVQQQQELRSRAAPTSNLTITPSTQTVAVGDAFTVDVSVDPGQNIVSYVQFDATFDPQFVEVISIEPNTSSFPLTLEGPNIGNGSAQLAVGIGGPNQGNAATGAIQTATTVATINLRALAETGTTPTEVGFVQSDTQILSLSVDDGPGENVLSSATPAQITIQAGSGVTPSPSVSPSVSPSISPSVAPATPTPTPTVAPNSAPQCTSLSVSPANSGVVPFSVNFTAEGSDDGLITKATFNFGDGDIQDVLDGLSASTVSTQQSHTYQNQGSYTVSVTFTDDAGAISQQCTQIIEVTAGTGAPGGDTGDTGTDTGTPSATPLPTKPPIADPGGVIETVAIAGGVILTIVGGILIFAL